MRHTPLAAFLASLVVALSSAAQKHFALDRRPAPLPFLQQVVAFTAGDFDNDGDVDLVVIAGYSGLKNILLLNDGTGVYAESDGLPLVTGSPHTLAAGDVDGDFDRDVLVAAQGTIHVFLNDGAARFRADPRGALTWNRSSYPNALMLADVDGNRSLDLFVTEGDHDVLFLNDGSGAFRNASANLPSESLPAQAAAAGDLDADGDLDLVIGNYPGSAQVWRNDGTGRFTETATLVTDRTVGVSLADFDGDGDLDVLLAGVPTLLFVNNGRGGFIMHTQVFGDRGLAVAGDLDRDGDVDVMTCRGSDFTAWVNDARAGFQAVVLPPLLLGEFVNHVGLVDADRDGDLDLLSFGRSAKLFWNLGKLQFFDPAPIFRSMPMAYVVAARCADVDGDADVDVVCADTLDGAGRFIVWRNDGWNLTEEVAQAQSFSGAEPRALAVADFDGDADVDAFLGCAPVPIAGGGQDRLYLNDGRGKFADATATHLPWDNDVARDAAVGDLDGDGRLDLVVATIGLKLYRNLGGGRFGHAPWQVTGAGRALSVALGDVDRDGDLDIVWGHDDVVRGPVRLLLNDGAGNLSAAPLGRMPALTITAVEIVVADFDGDRAADIFVASGDLAKWRDLLYLNDGNGTFRDVTASRLPDVPRVTTGAAVFDADGDGDLDLVASSFNDPWRFHRNESGLVFHDASSWLPPGLPDRPLLAAGDLDGDGDQDLLTHEGLILNMHNHARSTGPSRLGRLFPIEISASPGHATQLRLAVPLLSPRAIPGILLSGLGWLRLEPASTVPLPGLWLHTPAGTATLSLPIPANPALVGLDLHTQALVLDTAASFSVRLTNATRDRIH